MAFTVWKRRDHDRRHRRLYSTLVAPVHARYPQLSDAGNWLHWGTAPLGLRDRAARTAFRRPFSLADPPPESAGSRHTMMNSRLFTAAACIGVALILAGCGSTSKRGGYYKDDGPGSDIP